MIPDLDIRRAAQLMVKRYGEGAAIQAGMRAAYGRVATMAANWTRRRARSGALPGKS